MILGYNLKPVQNNLVKSKPLPLLKELSLVFEISQDSPSGLLWKKGRNVGMPAGGIRNGQYWYVMYKKEQWACHRFVWALYFDRDPAELQIDHIDQNKQNNNIGNLRLATSASNCHNRQLTPAIKKKKTSKYKGVYWHKPRNKWRARIVVNGKPKELGRFHKEEDAAKVYDLAAKQFYGQFAVLNFKDPLIILA